MGWLFAATATDSAKRSEDLRAADSDILCGMKAFVVLIPSLCSDLDHTFTPGSCTIACHILCVCESGMVSD